MYDEKSRKNPASARTDLNKLTMIMTMTMTISLLSVIELRDRDQRIAWNVLNLMVAS